MTTFRACYYQDPKTLQEILLTGPEHADLPADLLIAQAVAEAWDAGLVSEEGDWPYLTEKALRDGLRIGDWTERY